MSAILSHMRFTRDHSELYLSANLHFFRNKFLQHGNCLLAIFIDILSIKERKNTQIKVQNKVYCGH